MTDALDALSFVEDDEDDISSLDDEYRLAAGEHTLVVLEFLKILEHETVNWLIEKLTDPISKGGADLQVKLITRDKKGRPIYHVGADPKRLLEGAEGMRLKKRFQDGTMRDFVLENVHMYQDSYDLSNFLTTREKQQIILREMESVRFKMRDGGSEISVTNLMPGLPKLYKDQVIFSKCKTKKLLTYFPLHEKIPLKNLAKNWVRSFWKWQPIDDVHEYFGDSIAIYFAFLGFYTTFLAPPAVIGVFFYFLSFFISYNIIGFFCIFNIIWSSILLVLWKRECSKLTYKWGSINYKKFDEPRPQLWGYELEQNPITGKFEPCCHHKSKYYRFYTVSLPFIIISLAISLYLGIIYFWIEDYIRDWAHGGGQDRMGDHELEGGLEVTKALPWGAYIVSTLVTMSYAVATYVLDIVYRKLAIKLNDWENHRLQSSYDNFLIVKLVAFNFVNYFCTLFYVAFVMRDFVLLQKNLATLLITWQIIQQVQETILPYYAYKLKKFNALGPFKTKSDVTATGVTSGTTTTGGGSGVVGGGVVGGVGGSSVAGVDAADVEDEKHQIDKDANKNDYMGTIDDFLEMFLQFGYVFLFSAVYPTASLWAFLNNLIEIRTDAFKIIFIHKRPFAKTSDGIGAWLLAFELMGVMAVITNCALVALNDDVTRYFHSVGYSDLGILVLFVLIEHLLLFVKATINLLVPPTPGDIKTKLAKIEFEAHTAWMDKIKRESKFFHPLTKKDQ